jgi:hypothetical protein
MGYVRWDDPMLRSVRGVTKLGGMHSFVIQEPARAWLAARGGPPAELKLAEEALAARLALVLNDPKAAEEAAVLEALALEGSSRKAAAGRLGLAPRTFYKVLDRPGVQARAREQEGRLGHVLPPGPRGRPRVLDVPGLSEEASEILHRVHLATRRDAWYQAANPAEEVVLVSLRFTHKLLKAKTGGGGSRYQIKADVLAKVAG